MYYYSFVSYDAMCGFDALICEINKILICRYYKGKETLRDVKSK